MVMVKETLRNSLERLMENTKMQLKKLNGALFPLCYNDNYYADALASGDFTKLGIKLLNHALDQCSKPNIGEICLHVKTNNEDATSFYKKFGFKITDVIHIYYTNISPPDCYVVTKFIIK